MAGKAKFDQEAAFKSIIGADRRPAEKLQEETEKPKKNKDRVQRAYKNEKINGNIYECCYVLFVCRLQQ